MKGTTVALIAIGVAVVGGGGFLAYKAMSRPAAVGYATPPPAYPTQGYSSPPAVMANTAAPNGDAAMFGAIGNGVSLVNNIGDALGFW